MSVEHPIDVRDMAIVHRTFRNSFSEAAQFVRANPTPSAERVGFLGEHIDFAIGMLHHHHEAEDELLYPLLAQRVPDQAEMVNTIEAQHHAVTGAIDAVTTASNTWRASPTVDTGQALAAYLDELNAVLQPHLDDEEQRIVPLAAITVTQKEWDAMGESVVASIPTAKVRGTYTSAEDPNAASSYSADDPHLLRWANWWKMTTARGTSGGPGNTIHRPS